MSEPEMIGVTFFDSCCGAHWKFTLWILFALRKFESRVYFATWGKI